MGREKLSRDDIARRIGAARLLSLDVDGVLTNGELYYFEDGSETRVFNVQDGTGVKMVVNSGFPVALITGSTTPSIRVRGRLLGITHLYTGFEDKVGALEEICGKEGIGFDDVIHVGDDINDIPLLERVGFPLTVPNARPEVVERAIYVTQQPGGRGAVREVCELILKSRGRWPY